MTKPTTRTAGQPDDSDRYEDIPIESLITRWRKLPTSARAYARGYMSIAVENADAALTIAEEFAADEAAKSSTLH